MNRKLLWASLVSLWLISGSLFVLLFLIAYVVEWQEFSLLWWIIWVIIINTLMWLIAPRFQDLMQRRLYRMHWTTYEEFAKSAPKAAQMLQTLSHQYNIALPKLWIINDKNPTAFTYWSGPWNGRIIISQWMFEYCNDEEIAAVMAHEFGHIKHWDIAIMTLASTLLQIIFMIYRYARRASQTNTRNKKNPFPLIAAIAYIFYQIWQFILLYLSRVREYMADKFAAQHTDANALASALIKLAYGVISNESDEWVARATMQLWLVNIDQSKAVSMIYHDGNIDWQTLGKIALYDLYNPWAWLFELMSTHPVTWKRLEALMQYTTRPILDFAELRARFPLDKARMHRVVWSDIKAFIVPPIFWLLLSVLLVSIVWFSWLSLIWMVLIVWGSLLTAIAMRKFGDTNNEVTTIRALMEDPYVSPFRGKSVSIDGEVIGRWMPWYVFSEDVVVQDTTWLIYVDHQWMFGWLSNLLFSLSQVKKLIGQQVTARGWFIRHQKSMLVLQTLKVHATQKTINAYNKLYAYAPACILIIVWVLLLVVV